MVSSLGIQGFMPLSFAACHECELWGQAGGTSEGVRSKGGFGVWEFRGVGV